MTMIIALNAVPPEKTGLVAACIGVTLTIGGIAGPLISGTALLKLHTVPPDTDMMCRCDLQHHNMAVDLLHQFTSRMSRSCVLHHRMA